MVLLLKHVHLQNEVGADEYVDVRERTFRVLQEEVMGGRKDLLAVRVRLKREKRRMIRTKMGPLCDLIV